MIPTKGIPELLVDNNNVLVECWPHNELHGLAVLSHAYTVATTLRAVTKQQCLLS